MDPPAGPGPQILVVIPQMPDQIGDVIAVDRPVVCDARDPAQRVIGLVARGVHLADDRVFGTGDSGKCRHRGSHALVSVMVAHRFQRPRRVG